MLCICKRTYNDPITKSSRIFIVYYHHCYYYLQFLWFFFVLSCARACVYWSFCSNSCSYSLNAHCTPCCDAAMLPLIIIFVLFCIYVYVYIRIIIPLALLILFLLHNLEYSYTRNNDRLRAERKEKFLKQQFGQH